MKSLTTLIFTLFCTISATAQPWIGNVPGNIYYNQGSVGIGTIAPDTRLQIASSTGQNDMYGYVQTYNTTGGGNSGYTSKSYYGTSQFMQWENYGVRLGSRILTNGGLGDVVITSGGDSERMRILGSNGNVGIGTTSPGYPLHLYKVSAETGILTSWGGSNIYLSHGGWGIGAGKFGIGNGSTPTIVFDTNTNNVGIGTTTPGTLIGGSTNFNGRVLQIYGNAGGDANLVLSAGSSRYGQLTFENQLGTVGQRVINIIHEPDLLRFRALSESTGGEITSNILVLKTNGNVGIGTTSPEAKLTVKGKIVASEIQVKDIGVIADYVFKPDYQLMSLDKVEDYVKQNQHLPEVPSEKEFKKDGMNVAEMNVLLLKKVEELTLYAIKQNKKAEEQNKKVEELTLYSIDQNKSLKEQAKKIESLEKAVNNLISK